jgi:hypothetical protein
MASSCFLQLANKKLASLSDTSSHDTEAFATISQALHILLENNEGLIRPEDQAFISKITESNIPLKLEKIKKVFEKFILTKFLALKIDSQEAQEIVEMAIPLLQRITNEEKKQELLLTLLSLNPTEREQVCRLTKALFEQLPAEFHTPEIIKLISKAPKDDREEIFFYGNSLSKHIESPQNKAEVFEYILSLSNAHRSTICTLAEKFFISTQDSSHIIAILESINKMPVEQREAICSLLIKTFRHFPHGYYLSETMKILTNVHHEERESLISLVKSLQNESDIDVSTERNLRLLLEFPQEERKDFCDLVIPFCEKIPSSSERYCVMKSLSLYPFMFRAHVCAKAYPLFEKIEKKGYLGLILRSLKFFPVGNFEEVLHVIEGITSASSQELPISELHLTEKILSQRPYLKDVIIQAFDTELDAPRKQELLRQLAFTIHENYTFFHIPFNHPIIEKALIVLIQTRPSTSPKNPYHLYKAIQENARCETPDIPIEPESICGTLVTLSQKSLRSISPQNLSRKEFLRVCPDAVISSEEYLSMIRMMEKKIDELDPIKKASLLAQVQDQYISSFSSLCANLKDPFFCSLCEPTYGTDIPLIKAFFMAILSNIKQASSSFDMSTIFSEQERMMLMMSESIKNCKTGKADGIVLLYKLLDSRFHYNLCDKAVVSPSIALAQDYLKKMVTSKIDQILHSGNPLLNELSGIRDCTKQISHFSTYLKNMIGPHIGLAHDILFDSNTEILTDELVRKNLRELLQAFYIHLQPSKLILQLQESYTRLPEVEKTTLFNAFNELLGDSIPLDQVWLLCPESEAIMGLTSLGAITLFHRANLFIFHNL